MATGGTAGGCGGCEGDTPRLLCDGLLAALVVVGFDTRNYGGQTLSLRQSPDAGSKVVFSFKEEMQLHPVGMKGDWVKVKTSDGKHEGWIETEWICDNPLTNCC